MEERAQYGPWQQERPRLVVVKDDGTGERFSALPHAVIRNTSLSRDARLLVATIQMYAWQDSECSASHATLAADMGCSARMLRVYLTELIEAGVITEHDAGARRQKVYRLVSIGTVLPIETTVNEQPASDYTYSNRKFSTVQSEVFDTSNRKPASDSKKKTPEKKTKEEELAPTELGAADAATPATAPKAKASSSKKTACPQTFPLEAKHFEYGSGLGLSETRVRAETDKFLAHHRFKGTLGLDWYAGWQNWMRRAVQYDAPRGASTAPTNGTPPMPPGAATAQKSRWSEPGTAAGWRKLGQPGSNNGR